MALSQVVLLYDLLYGTLDNDNGNEGREPLGESMYRVGELARAARVNPRTIDYYTRAGLLAPEAETRGRHRLYAESALQRLRLIRDMQERGYTLNQIREHLDQAPGEVAAELVRLEQDLERLSRKLAEVKGQPLDPRYRALLEALAVKGMAAAQTLLMLLSEQPPLP